MMPISMKYLISLLLIISLVSLSVFGFVIFSHKMIDEKSGCLASTSDGVPCPVNTIDLILHHVLFLKTFSQALISPLLVLIISLVLLFMLAAIFWGSRQELPYSKFKFLLAKSPGLIVDRYSNQKKFIRWLALLEQSPASIISAR